MPEDATPPSPPDAGGPARAVTTTPTGTTASTGTTVSTHEPTPSRAPGPDAPATTPAAPDRSRRGGPGAVGVAGAALAALVLRLVVTWPARYPVVVADEAAYLAMARALGGGPRWDLGMASTYAPGYSVLLAPWFALDVSPDAAFRSAVVTNAVLGALLVVAVAALLARLTDLGPAVRAVVALVATSAPALTVTGALAWSDSLTPLAFAVLALAGLRLLDRPNPGPALVLAGVAVAAVASHRRFLPLVAVVLATLAGLAWSRRLRPGAALAAAVVVVAGLAAVDLGSAALHDHLYEPGGQVDTAAGELGRITRLGPLALSSLGQAWALLAATAGLVGLGAVALARAAAPALWDLRRPGGRPLLPRRAGRAAPSPDPDGTGSGPGDGAGSGVLPLEAGPALLLLALVAISFATSAAFMADRPRADHLIYGRYNDVLVAPLAALGLAALVGAAPLRRRLTDLALVTAALVGAGGTVWLLGRETLSGEVTPFTIIGVLAVEPGGPTRLRAATATALVATVVVAAAGLLRRGRAAAVLAVTAVLVVAGTGQARTAADPTAMADPRHAAELARIVAPGEEVGYLVVGADGVLSQFYRFPLYLPDLVHRRVVSAPADLDAPLVVADAGQADLAGRGFRLAWVDTTSRAGLWVAPGPGQEARTAAGELLPPGGLGAPWPDEVPAAAHFTEGPRVDGDRLTASVRVDRAGSPPWPATGGTVNPTGRVRLGVVVTDDGCRCPVAEVRADLDGWVPAGVDAVTFAVDAPLPELGPGPHTVTAQVLREGIARFGTPATAALAPR